MTPHQKCFAFLFSLVVSACGAGNGSPGDSGPDSSSAIDAADDGRAPGNFLDTCGNDWECASEFCIDGPDVCTRTCNDRFDCPLASSWRCAEVMVQQHVCLCPGLTAAPGCDTDCDGVDQDPTGTWRHAVQSSLLIVQTAAETAQYAFDLDRSGTLDNSFGRMVVPFFAAIVTGSPAPNTIVATLNQEAVTAGHILNLHSFHGDSTQTDGCASWRVYQANPMTPPDFSGAGVFDLDAAVPPGSTLYGSVSGGVFRASFGEAPVRLHLGRAVNAKVLFHLRGVELEARLGASGCASGRLGGGIPAAELPSLIGALTAEINYVLTFDPQGAEAQQLRATFDANHDNSITVAEVGAVVSFTPDVDLLDASGNRGRDGVADSLSIALAFGCAGATYVAPGE